MISDAVLINTRVEINASGLVLTKAKLIFAILAIILFTLIGFQLVLANQLATQGQRASELETKIKNFQDTNEDLKMQISQKGSLTEILEQAKELGFKKPQEFFFVKENFAVAKKM